MEASPDLRPALDIIQAADPDTYARMAASDWHVGTDYDAVMTPVDDAHIATLNRDSAISDSLGATQSNLDRASGQPGNPPQTYINFPAIADRAHDLDVPTVDLVADVMVHEFRHTTQGGHPTLAAEVPAFEASTLFAYRLPARYAIPIAEMSTGTLMYLARES